MSNIFLFLINNGRIPPYLIFYLLLMPIVVTLVAFTRQVVGIRMFGAFAPIIATYAFLGTGLFPGILVSAIIFASAMILRWLTRRLRLHYLPRISLLITMICIVLLLLIPFAVYLPFINMYTIGPTSVILFIILSDIYLTSEIQQGYKNAMKLYLETIVVSCAIFLLVSWTSFQAFLIRFPEIVILCLIIDLLLGRWKGLRLTEVYRFRSIIKEKAKDYA